MNQESIDLISQLASKLDTSVEILIGLFAMRAPYEFVAVALSIVFIAVALLFVYIGFISYERSNSKDRVHSVESYQMTAGVFLLFGGVLGLVGLCYLADALYMAIMAVASPEAYAIEEILKAVG